MARVLGRGRSGKVVRVGVRVWVGGTPNPYYFPYPYPKPQTPNLTFTIKA